MPDVQMETVLLLQARGQQGKLGRVKFLDPLAVSADHVHMLIIATGRVIGRRTMRQMHMCHQIELFQKLQRPIDRRDIDAWRTGDYSRMDLLRRGMAETAHGVEHQFALWRQSQPAIAQECGKVGHFPILAKRRNATHRRAARHAT